MTSDPTKKSWEIVLEHSFWCVAWGAAAPLASQLAPIVDHAWARVARGVLPYPMNLHSNLAWAMGYLNPAFEPQAQLLRSLYSNANSTWSALLPPILNFALFAVPTVLVAGFLFHLLPWIRNRLRHHRPAAVECRPLPARPVSVRYVFIIGANLSSLPLLWMFWITILFISMVGGLGDALSTPSVREPTTLITLIANTLALYATIGIPTLLFPISLTFLRRQLQRGWPCC